MDNNISPDKASFNQAQYQQIRINDIILRMDRLGINPCSLNPDLHEWNYIIIANDLFSLLATISSKMTSKEKEDMIKKKEEITNLINTKPYSKKGFNEYGNKIKIFSPKNFQAINNKLFLFRLDLELLMDVHGFGNPSKDDPRKSVFKGV